MSKSNPANRFKPLDLLPLATQSVFIVDEGTLLGHVHYACLDRFSHNMHPDCCICTGHICKTIQCSIPSISSARVKEVLAKIELEVLMI